MSKLHIVALITILFLSSNLTSLANDSPSEKKKYSNFANLISNNRFVKLSSLGFAGNESAANKKLLVDKSITFSPSSVPAPIEMSEKLENAGALVGHAKKVFNKVTKNRLFLTTLKGKKIDLPFGVTKTIGQKEYTIVVDSIVLTPEYAYGVIYTILTDPQSGDSLAFGAKVTLSQDGGFASNGGKLFLLSNETISFGNNNSIEFLGSSGDTSGQTHTFYYKQILKATDL